MHCAVTLAEHAVRAVTSARTSQPTRACTVHVAWQEALHLSSHVEALPELHCEAH
jgi:hypothetical protein